MRGNGSVNAPTLIGLGIGFAAIGAVFSLLIARKPDLALFRKYTEKQFGRTQGMLAMFVLFGLLLIFQGAMLLLGTQEGENPAAAMMGWGFGIAVIFGILGVLSVCRPDSGIFKRYPGKKLYQSQGTLLTAAAFGLMFFLLGLMGKPWAV